MKGRVSMLNNSTKYITPVARSLRSSMTGAERLLWSHLRRKKLNRFRFRRQHPIGRYIVDFYCHELKLIIELDGAVHENTKEYDHAREVFIKACGYTVLHFTNDEVEKSIEVVLEKIIRCIENF